MNHTLLPINGFLILAVALASGYNVTYWWFATRGTWREWPAGRSLMALLTSLTFMSGTAAFTVLIKRDWVGKPYWYGGLYTLVLLSLIYVGYVIHYEIRIGRMRPDVDPRHSTGADVHYDKYDDRNPTTQENPHV